MGHLYSYLVELDKPTSLRHIGGLRNFMEPLCKELSEDETSIIGWIPQLYQPISPKNVCPPCFGIYEELRRSYGATD